MAEATEIPAPGAIADLRDRLERAERAERVLRDGTPSAAFERKDRLDGKIEGIRLALSYLHDLQRTREGVDLEHEIARALTFGYIDTDGSLAWRDDWEADHGVVEGGAKAYEARVIAQHLTRKLLQRP